MPELKLVWPKMHSLLCRSDWIRFLLLICVCQWEEGVVYLLLIFLIMSYDSSLSDPWNIAYLWAPCYSRSLRLWWNLDLSCSLLKESSFFSPQKMKCFCLPQFVGLSISYLGEMVVNWGMWMHYVNGGGWNTWSKCLNCFQNLQTRKAIRSYLYSFS